MDTTVTAESEMTFSAQLVQTWHTFRLAIIAVTVLVFVLIRYFRLSVPAQKAHLAVRPEKQPNSPQTSVKSVKSRRASPKRAKVVKRTKSSSPDKHLRVQPHIFFFSLSGTTERLAGQAAQSLRRDCHGNDSTWLEPELHDLAGLDYDEFFLNSPSSSDSIPFYLILLPSYDIDTEISSFIDHLTETHNDFRVDTGPLSTSIAGYSVFGIGDSENWPGENKHSGFCFQARSVDAWMARLTGRKRAYPLGLGDIKDKPSSIDDTMREWLDGVKVVLTELAAGQGLGQGVQGSGDAMESDEESEQEAVAQKKSNMSRLKNSSGTTPDLEDLGGTGAPLAVDFTTYSDSQRVTALPEMVPKSSSTYAALTKQGYAIVGSHSGVKICRWTKSALRGRGSCYKFSFYGIKSHLCMETTPSLSCSNKCVFCWRKSTNPVGTTWKWQVDPPDMILSGVKEGHYKKIKMMKGVPGVRADRFAEAMQIRHCALSLVGEPIFYPHINEFTAMLHREHISSFLVCNAQHPDELAALAPVTQLYVSIDASNKESLRKIDRPLHRDFWERFCRCLDILREKRFTQRTVFRLTLVKGFNIDEEIEGYADLVQRALPGLVEVKGVTYCGTSTSAGAGLTMQNVPWHAEVCSFVAALTSALQKRGLDYGIAAEHAHSCCILIADKQRFHQEDGWHTLIDYDKFFACLERGGTFSPEDYIGARTPDWAMYGSETGGFNPADERVDRKGNPKEITVVRS